MPRDRNLLQKIPFNLILNPEAIRKQRPWDIDIERLLATFLDTLKESELLDLRLCGSVAISSSLIFRLKVETLFIFEKLRLERKIIQSQEPSKLLEMPYRHELYATSVEELISTLGTILEGLVVESQEKPQLSIIEPEPPLEVDQFSLQIKEMLSSFRSRIFEALNKTGELLFSEYVKGIGVLEAVRSFILLLFIATEGLISLEQSGDDIKISRETEYVC